MKRLFFYIIFSLFAYYSIAQDIYIVNRTTDFLWYGIPNLVQINVDIEKSNLIIKSNNGDIYNVFDSTFSTIPKNYKLTTLSIYRIEGNDSIKVAEKNYNVKPLPRAEAFLTGGHSNDSISRNILCVQVGIKVSVINYDIDLDYEPISYEILIIQKDSVLYTKKCFGYLFSEETKKVFKTLEKGDRVFIYNIESKDYYLGKIHKEGQINIFIK